MAVAKGATVREKQNVTNRLIDILQAIPGCMVRKRHQDAWSVVGDPDVYGCLRGLHFEIEVKTPKKNPEKIQNYRIEKWEASGAFCAVVRSQQDALVVALCLAHAAGKRMR